MPSSPSNSDIEPFPSLDPALGQTAPSPRPEDSPTPIVNRQAASSSLSGRLRNASQTFGQSSPPEGFLAATSGIASSIVSLPTTARQRGNSGGSSSTQQALTNDHPARRTTFPPVTEELPREEKDGRSTPSAAQDGPRGEPVDAAPFANGYHFPPKHSFAQSTALGLRAFLGYFLTPVGFLVTIYGLNVVAWGGMLFLLLW